METSEGVIEGKEWNRNYSEADSSKNVMRTAAATTQYTTVLRRRVRQLIFYKPEREHIWNNCEIIRPFKQLPSWSTSSKNKVMADGPKGFCRSFREERIRYEMWGREKRWKQGERW